MLQFVIVYTYGFVNNVVKHNFIGDASVNWNQWNAFSIVSSTKFGLILQGWIQKKKKEKTHRGLSLLAYEDSSMCGVFTHDVFS
jgi:uncharacterized membrane protein